MQPSKPNKLMVSSTEIGGDNTPNSKANWNKNKPKPGSQVPRFIGDATSDSVLHGKVITNGSNQDGQLITLCKAIPSYIGSQHYPDWAESFRIMTRKTQAEFMPIAPRRRDYGADDALGVFQWRANTLNTEEEYDRDCAIWERSLGAGIKQAKDYVNHGEYIFLTIQGQVEPSLWDKTKDDVRFAAIQTLKCPIALINLMKEMSTGTMSGLWQPLALMAHLQQTVQH